jgi:hypothetical protein
MRLVSFYSGNNRLRLVLLFANNWSSDLIYGCFRSLANKFPIKNFALGIPIISEMNRLVIIQ